MTGLPKKYIKKYGVSKKAWAEFRKAQRKRRTSLKPVKRTITGKIKVRRMAKRRKRSYSKKRSGGIMNNSTARSLMSKGGTILYGGLRAKMSNALTNSKIGQLLPQTRISDELGMYGLAYVAGKMGGNKIPVVSSMIRTAKTVELARIGEELFTGGLNLFGSNDNNGGNLF